MHILNYNSSFLSDNFSFTISNRLYYTSFKLNIVNVPRTLPFSSPLSPLRASQCPPDPHLCLISQFMQNPEYFSFLMDAQYRVFQILLKKLYGNFLLMGFNFLKATEPLWGAGLSVNSKSLIVNLTVNQILILNHTHLINLQRMKD